MCQTVSLLTVKERVTKQDMPRRASAASAEQETGTAPVSYFRVYNPELVRDFKVRAVELGRYLQDCWEEAARAWLAKEKPVSPAAGRGEKFEPKLIGIRMDPGLAQKLKVRAAKLSRANGDCLEEAGIDWLRRNRARGKERP